MDVLKINDDDDDDDEIYVVYSQSNGEFQTIYKQLLPNNDIEAYI